MPSPARPRSVETAVIGAGQAGLAMSWYLAQAGREHIVLERRRTLGGGWQDRWDEFCLVTPNWSTSLPGYPYEGDDPDGFMPRDAIAGRIAGYAAAIRAPVELGTSVDRLLAVDHSGFLLETSAGPVAARQVIVATGPVHEPKIPALAAALPARVFQLHSHHYRKPADLPPGAVLVVGSGQSGVQLTEELQAAGRRVYLSVGSAGRVPRRYRGRDIFWWLAQMGCHDARQSTSLPTVGALPDPRLRFVANPQLSGHGGGHETNLRRMAAGGITLLGRMEGVEGERVRLGADLPANLAAADCFFDGGFRPRIDAYIDREGLDAPPDDREPFDFEPPAPAELDLQAAGITSVLWTSGYKLDFGWLDLPILDEWGVPRQDRGVSDVPGLYFIGLPWQHTQLSATLVGVAWDAAHLARRVGGSPPNGPLSATRSPRASWWSGERHGWRCARGRRCIGGGPDGPAAARLPSPAARRGPPTPAAHAGARDAGGETERAQEPSRCQPDAVSGTEASARGSVRNSWCAPIATNATAIRLISNSSDRRAGRRPGSRSYMSL